MLEIPTLVTERLVLRPWKPKSDARAVFAYASQPEAARYMIFDIHRTLDDAQDFLNRTITSPEHAYAITIKNGDDVPIGGCGITPTTAHRRGEIGYILHRDYWNIGYGTETARRLVRYGFEDLHLNRIYARADIRNPASTRVMIKAGMQIEGTLREEMIIRGEACSFIYCSVLRSEWAEKPSQLTISEELF